MSGRCPFQELSREFTAERHQRIDAIKRELLSSSQYSGNATTDGRADNPGNS